MRRKLAMVSCEPVEVESPEKGLLLALLVGALRDVGGGDFRATQHERKGAMTWLMNDKDASPFSIRWVVEHLFDDTDHAIFTIQHAIQTGGELLRTIDGYRWRVGTEKTKVAHRDRGQLNLGGTI